MGFKTHGAQLWDCSSQSSNACIQRFQNKVLRSLVNPPWYARSADIHRDLGVNSVTNEIDKISSSQDLKRRRHVNQERENRLKRQKSSDLAT